MKRKLIVRILLLGFLSWLIPFAVSFLFFKPGGELIVAYSTFKCIIGVTGTLSGCYLLYRYFKPVDGNYIENGVIVGLCWFFINIILDTLILIPMMKSTFPVYFITIGISYLAIPTISIAMGFLLESKIKKQQ